MNIYSYINEHKGLTSDQREFILAYAEALLWSSDLYEFGEPVEYGLQKYVNDCSLALCSRVVCDCIDHLREASHLIIRAGIDVQVSVYDNVHYTFEQAGHDLALTRNHHGAGYWDRGLGDIGEQLTTLAQEMGGIDLYIGDDGLLYDA